MTTNHSSLAVGELLARYVMNKLRPSKSHPQVGWICTNNINSDHPNSSKINIMKQLENIDLYNLNTLILQMYASFEAILDISNYLWERLRLYHLHRELSNFSPVLAY